MADGLLGEWLGNGDVSLFCWLTAESWLANARGFILLKIFQPLRS